MNATSTFYQVSYRIGFHSWDDAAEEPAFVETIVRLFEEEESGRYPPYGQAHRSIH